MTTRRAFFRTLTATAVAAMVLVVPAIADELVGRITKVDSANKKITVTEKGTDKEVEVTVNDETILETPKGESKVDLSKLEKRLEKAKKGISVKVTHEQGVASKIKVEARKKAAAKN